MRRCKTENALLFLSLNETSTPPSIDTSVVVRDNLTFTACKGNSIIRGKDLATCMQFSNLPAFSTLKRSPT